MEELMMIAVTVIISFGMSMMMYMEAECENRRRKAFYQLMVKVIKTAERLHDEIDLTREMVGIVIEAEEVKKNRMPIEMTEVVADDSLR